jgi:hypothetical protein
MERDTLFIIMLISTAVCFGVWMKSFLAGSFVFCLILTIDVLLDRSN